MTRGFLRRFSAAIKSRIAFSFLTTLIVASFSIGAFDADAADKVNINKATREEMQEINGIGPKLADSIVTDREDNGSFASVEDLARVPGVSSGLVQKLYKQVSVSTAAARSGSSAVILREGEKVSRRAVRSVLKKFGAEPGIRDVQEAAIRHARADPGLIDSMRWRLRTAGALPKFRVDGDGRQDLDLAERNEVGAPNVLVSEDDKTFSVGVSATWDLDRLIFSRHELSLSRETVRLGGLRDRVVDEVTRRYFERRRLQVDLELAPSTDLSDSVRKELRLQELTADLDALTGGWFSNQIDGGGF